MSQPLSLRQFLALGMPLAQGGASTGRDARIDVIRGLALMIIFINHMPGNVLALWTPHNFGFSDAADAFVLLAGISAALAYGSAIEARGFAIGVAKVAARIWTLYVAHIAVFLIVCGVIAVAVTRTQNPLYIEAINIQPFFNDTPAALVDALTLLYQPDYLNILPLYIVLLMCFPAIYWGVRLSPALTLVASVAIWQGAVAFELNLPSTSSTGWFFNPFAWQLLFTIGVVIGRAAQLGVKLPRRRILDAAAIGFLVLAAVVKTSSGNPFGIVALNDWVDSVQMGSDKTNLAWSRIAHAVALAWLVMRFLPAGAGLLAVPGGRVLAGAGRHSLEVFCVGLVLSIMGQVVLAETAFAIGAQLLVCLFGVTMLAGLGIFLTWYQSVAQRAAPGLSPTLAQGGAPVRQS